MDALTTGRLAALAGVNTETLRYYERRGLLASPARTRSGYRNYPVEAVEVVLFIKRAQGLGFSLKEIKELLSLDEESGHSCGDVKDRACGKIEEIEAKVRQLKSMLTALRRVVKRCPGEGPLSRCSILESLKEGYPLPRNEVKP